MRRGAPVESDSGNQAQLVMRWAKSPNFQESAFVQPLCGDAGVEKLPELRSKCIQTIVICHFSLRGQPDLPWAR